MGRIRVLSPIGEVTAEAISVPPLPPTWAGRTVGFLDNTKSNFDRLVTEIGVLMRD